MKFYGDEAEIRARLKAAKGFVFDLDGTLALGDARNQGLTPREGAVELLNYLDEQGIPFTIYTNGTVRPPSQYVPKLQALGFPITIERMMTPSTVAADVLPRRGHQRVLVLGVEGVWGPLKDAGLEVVHSPSREPVDAVWVGWYHEFTMKDIEAAVEAIEQGALIYSASGAPWFSTAQGKALGTSMVICGALEGVTGKKAEILGKPSKEGVEVAARRLGTTPEHLVIMGDDLNLEIAMARRDGALAVFTRSGVGGLDPVSLPADRQPHLEVNLPTEVLTLLLD